MLQEVKEKLTLQDFVDSQASKQVECTFDVEISELTEAIGALDMQKNSLDEKLSEFASKKRTKDINDYFKGYLKFAQAQLGIKDPVTGTIVQHSTIVKGETGSRAPRAILAYQYALLKTIEDKSTIPMLPVIIDSPKQQDTDDDTAEKIFDLCIDGLSQKNQLIIGTVSFDRKAGSFNTLTMTDRYNLLKSDLYEEVCAEIMPLYKKMTAAY